MNFNVLLHPYRFLIASVLSEEDASVKSLKKALPEVPQAALYRGINKLLEAGLIYVKSENKVRGAVEATYALNLSFSNMPIDDLTKSDMQLAAFMTFFTYVNREIKHNLELSRFNSTQIKMNPEKFQLFVEDFKELMGKYHDDEGQNFQLTTFLVAKGDEYGFIA